MNYKSNIKISILFFLVFLSVINGQTVFNHPFNPVQGMVTKYEKPLREELCLNGSWQFMPVYENKFEKFKKPEKFSWEKIPLKIPSPWNVNSFPAEAFTSSHSGNSKKSEGGDFNVYPGYPREWEKAEMGWMKKEFTVSKNLLNKELILHFEAIAGFAEIYVNGKLAGKNLDIFLPTEVNVSSLIKEGINEIIVGVAKASLTDQQGKYGRRNYVAGSFWGTGIVGIWQDVYLFAYPKVYISDVFVKPDVAKHTLSVEVEVTNSTNYDISISANAIIKKWVNLAGNSIIEAPSEKWELGETAAQIENSNSTNLEANSKVVLTFSKNINNELAFWTPDNPNLYGMIIQLMDDDNEKIIDNSYKRFGWRQFTIEGSKLLLNGKPIVLKGDSWHFMGIPQMTRRYAWAWFKMVKEANGNAVRLHAQPCPRFYLDVADEIGMCVLDETGIWSSDGGPKMDSDEYWEQCRKHVKNLVLRDRNHPSIFGWSVCNETLPVAIYVFHAPESIVKRQIDEINMWVKIVRENDPTRDWISGDGETMMPTDLPTVIGHYGGYEGMKEWASQNKPWGIGEQGMAYYGTPKQVSIYNGDRSYESMLGRTEGLAIEAYQLLNEQRKLDASYMSIFNIVWYGLQPLELGLKDLTKIPAVKDGIHFGEFIEGVPGVQPERLGPYSTTLNPGYDSELPMFKPWPLFEAVKAAYSTPVADFSIKYDEAKSNLTTGHQIKNVILLSGNPDKFKENYNYVGIPYKNDQKPSAESMILIDGNNPPADKNIKKLVNQNLQAGGTVFVWGGNRQTQQELNEILPYPVVFSNRESTSLVIKNKDEITGSLGNKDFYFSEIMPDPIISYGMKGSLAEKGKIILEACNTDWSVWNYRAEYVKTSSVARSERESKEDGAALIKTNYDKGIIYLSTIDLVKAKTHGKNLFRSMLANLNVNLEKVDYSEMASINEDNILSKALICGPYSLHGLSFETAFEKEFLPELTTKPVLGQKTGENTWEIAETNNRNVFDLKNAGLKGDLEAAAAYLSFWVFSPRSLSNLLAEPDMPKLDMIVGADDGFVLYLDGKDIYHAAEVNGFDPEEYTVKNIPLNKGWNHIMIKAMNTGGDWRLSAKFKSDNEEFIKTMKSSIEN